MTFWVNVLVWVLESFLFRGENARLTHRNAVNNVGDYAKRCRNVGPCLNKKVLSFLSPFWPKEVFFGHSAPNLLECYAISASYIVATEPVGLNANGNQEVFFLNLFNQFKIADVPGSLSDIRWMINSTRHIAKTKFIIFLMITRNVLMGQGT